MKFDSTRERQLKHSPKRPEGNIIYWMSRDQRIVDNWALIAAYNKAREVEAGLAIVFNLLPKFKQATLRQYDFMLRGLAETAKTAEQLNIPFYILFGDLVENLKSFSSQYNVHTIYSDFSPLNINKHWKAQLKKELDVNLLEVDAHNIVPCWLTSDKQEYAARTIRPKLNAQLDKYLTSFPKLEKFNNNWNYKVPKIDWPNLIKQLEIDKSIKPVDWLEPGSKAAQDVFDIFLEKKFAKYAEQRNDPNKNVLSNLSPYLHFGQISAQQIAKTITDKFPSNNNNAAAFLEELIIRRELSDNYCYYNENYDNPKGFPEWARKTLQAHRNDKREHLYTKAEFEAAATHDDLWNAAQRQMLTKGKMHGYMRMYWAKKILEWTESVEQAQKIAIYLNDKFFLDGRDANGYTGIAWSLGGVHDQGWKEREIFGKIRYMNANGAKRKFDVEQYINASTQLDLI